MSLNYDYEAQPREIIASIAIVCVMLIFGFMISNKISYECTKDNLKYEQAIQITDEETFGHCLDTSVGASFSQGVVVADNPVSTGTIDGQYMCLREIVEEYTYHEEEVEEEDEDGNVTTHTETWYSWDKIGENGWSTDTVTFLGRQFSFGTFANQAYQSQIGVVYKDGSAWSSEGDIRWVYYAIPCSYNATVYADIQNGEMQNAVLYTDKTIEEAVELSKGSAVVFLVMFWFFWIALIIGLVVMFCWLENNWLNED